ncbi:MAG: putative DNA binding domain-containing protein [Nitrospira sp.]|nr:putative DNA binding domain-containing protein [Nitrospira sp.]
MRLNDAELEKMMSEGESFRAEYKESLADNALIGIQEAVCAFANDLSGSGQPGVVFIGVKNNGEPIRLDITDQMLIQLSNIKTDGNIVPPPSMLVEKRRLKGADVAVITVLPSDSPPVRYKGAIHIRSGPRRGIATEQDERILNEKRRAHTLPFDIQPVPGATVSDLSVSRFEEEYLPKAFSAETLEANERSTNQRLATTKMLASADNQTATVLGLLVLGKRPRDIIPNSYIQFLRIDGVELSGPIVDNETIDGTIQEILRRIDDKMKAHISTGVDLTSSDKERRESTYPLAAIQQLTRNAVMHRAYEATNAPVRVTWFNDRIEIHNPGGAFGTVTRENFGHPGVTDYRNPNLAEAMKVMGYVQRFGVGIATAKKELEKHGHPEPDFVVEDAFVQVTIRGRSL